MEYYKLIDAITTPINVSVLTKRAAGGHVYGHVRLEPGMAYKMPTDDTEFRKSVLAATTNIEMSHKQSLDESGAKYEVVRPSCHCRKPYLKVKCVEVFEGESD